RGGRQAQGRPRAPHRALHVVAHGVLPHRRDVRAPDRALHRPPPPRRRRRGRRRRHAHRRFLLRHGVGLSRRPHRLIEQPDLGPYAVDAHRRRAPHGRVRRARDGRRGGGPRGRRGRVRVVGGGGRAPPRLPGRPPPPPPP